MANIGAAALEAVNGRRFKVGNIASTIYLSSGSSADYAYDNAGVPYACGLEVRPAQGAIDGFNPPPSQIEPSGREVYAGLIAYVQNVQWEKQGAAFKTNWIKYEIHCNSEYIVQNLTDSLLLGDSLNLSYF